MQCLREGVGAKFRPRPLIYSKVRSLSVIAHLAEVCCDASHLQLLSLNVIGKSPSRRLAGGGGGGGGGV